MTQIKNQNFESLQKRVKDLENKIKNLGSLNMFGRQYSQVGSSSSDFLIKTKGQVKIQWGNKFIDLIKDGKINADAKFIYVKDEVDSKDGIYVKSDGSSVILKAGDSKIDLLGGAEGTTYVSFLGEQSTTSEQKYQALTNIGFIYPSLESIDSSSLQNGVIYVESEHKLYIVQEGQLTELSLEIPNPYTEQFIIAKNDSKQGAILIQGNGINNSLAFNDFYIYYQEQKAYFKSPYSFIFTIGNSDILKIDSSSITANQQIISSMFKSPDSSNNYGFRLYTLSGISTLEVDSLIVRNGITSTLDTYPMYWWAESNVVDSTESNDSSYDLTLRYTNTFKVGDCLYTFINQKIEEDQSSQDFVISREAIQLTVTQSNSNAIEVVSNTSINYSNLNNVILFKINVGTLIKNSNKGLDIISSNSFEDEQNIQSIHTRVGNLSEFNLHNITNGQEEEIDDKNGIYSQNGIFKVIQYSSDYSLPESDNSSKLASTEWIIKLVDSLLPVGSIIAFSGNTIPENWALCDGTNGTPNLVGKFIKAGSSTGEEGGKEEITIGIENLPSHTHTVTSENITTSISGGHSHTVQYSSGNPGVTEEGSDFFVGTETTSTNTTGEHSHTVNLSELQLSSIGESKPIEWEPKYFSLMFIMRIK